MKPRWVIALGAAGLVNTGAVIALGWTAYDLQQRLAFISDVAAREQDVELLQDIVHDQGQRIGDLEIDRATAAPTSATPNVTQDEVARDMAREAQATADEAMRRALNICVVNGIC